jgi:hypothetical protein
MTGRTARLAEIGKRLDRDGRSWRLPAMKASLAIQVTMLTVWLIRIGIRARDVRRASRAAAAPTEL